MLITCYNGNHLFKTVTVQALVAGTLQQSYVSSLETLRLRVLGVSDNQCICFFQYEGVLVFSILFVFDKKSF